MTTIGLPNAPTYIPPHQQQQFDNPQSHGLPPGNVYPPSNVYPQSNVYPPSHQQPFCQPTPTFQTPAPATTNTEQGNNYSKKAGCATGILQICVGAVLLLLGIINLRLGTRYRLAWNIWEGVFYIVTGIMGLISTTQNKCVIVAYAVMCSISAVCAAGLVFYDGYSAKMTSIEGCYYYKKMYRIDEWIDDWNRQFCENKSTIVMVHSLAGLFGFIELVIAIVTSVYCCYGVVSRSTQVTVVTLTQPAPLGQTQLVTMLSPAPYPGQQGSIYPTHAP